MSVEGEDASEWKGEREHSSILVLGFMALGLYDLLEELLASFSSTLPTMGELPN